MPILSIFEQASAGSIRGAYRPIVFRVKATATDGSAEPPVVYCDVYINGIFYRTNARTQFETLNSGDSNWYFDVQEPCQEVLKKFLATNGSSSIINADGLLCSVFCRFRSSGIDAKGFIQPEGTAPVQGTGKAAPVAGSGTQSNEIIVVNSVLQHEDNQDIITHLNSFKSGVWQNVAFPMSHRPNGYQIGDKDNDFFPILYSGSKGLKSVKLFVKYKGTTTFVNAEGSTPPPPCNPVSLGSVNLPSAKVGVQYNGSINFSGTAPVTLTNFAAPAGLSYSLGSGVVNITGTPTAAGNNQVISFTLNNCSGSTVGFSQAINISEATTPPPQCVDVTIPSYTLPAGTTGSFYQIAIPFSGTTPIEINNVTRPGWLGNPVVGYNTEGTGGFINFSGTPANDDAGNATIAYTLTNCATGSATFNQSFTVTSSGTPPPPQDNVQWDYDNSVGNGGTFRISVNGTNVVTENTSGSGSFVASPGDAIVVTVLSTTQGRAKVNINGTISQEDHVVQGDITYSSGTISIQGFSLPA